MKQNLPNLVVIGAMKAGTTSLHNYLDAHPQVYMAPEKELNFFSEKQVWENGLAWYGSNFKQQLDIVGESSPNYTKCHAFPDVPERMYKILPNAKLIYILRDPIKRIASHYFHQYIARCEHRTINEALKDLDNNHYIQCSQYAFQLKQFLSYYTLDNILVITLEDLYKKPVETLKQVFEFLQIASDFQHPDFSVVHHNSSIKRRRTNFGAKLCKLPGGPSLCDLIPGISTQKVVNPHIDSQLRSDLEEFLREDINELRLLTRQSFQDWSC